MRTTPHRYLDPVRTYQGPPRYIYAGPSWAVSSFPESQDSTNLAWEWEISNIGTAAHGSSVIYQRDSISEVLETHRLPIIWVYNEPLNSVIETMGIDLSVFVTRKDWKQILAECNRYCLAQINNLGVPVLLIGGHSDVVDCDYPNITVGCHSWQKWLAEQSGMSVVDDIIKVTPPDGGNYDLGHCWGAETVHRYLHQHPDVKPDPDLLNAVWDVYYFWDELQRRDWFFEVHPNKRGNIEFAKFLKPTVDKFLEENSNG